MKGKDLKGKNLRGVKTGLAKGKEKKTGGKPKLL